MNKKRSIIHRKNYPLTKKISFMGILILIGTIFGGILYSDNQNVLPLNRSNQEDDTLLLKYEETNINDTQDTNYSPISAFTNPINITDDWDIFWNGSIGFDSFIEYDPVLEAFYTANLIDVQILDSSSRDINLSKYNEFGVCLWNKTFGQYNLYDSVYELLLAPNGTEIYLISSYVADYSETIIKIYAINSLTGNLNWDLTIQDGIQGFISSAQIVENGKFMYLAGINYPTIINEDAAIWKVNLYSHSIDWDYKFEDVQNNDEFIDFTLSEDEEYIYLIGLRNRSNEPYGGEMIYCQLNSTGTLFSVNINSTETNQIPVDIELSFDEKYLLIFATDNTGLDFDLSIIRWDLAGNVINKTVYEDNGKDNAATKLYPSPWNQSYYIIGQVAELSNSQQAYIAEINEQGTILWENQTKYLGSSYFESYADLVISDENERITAIGLTTKEIETVPNYFFHLFSYNLTQEPAPPTLFSDDFPSYDGKIELNWTSTLRSLNYSIYRSTSAFTSIEESTLIASGITDLFYTDSDIINLTYYYRIVACGHFGNSTPSNMLELIETSNHTSYLYPISVESGSFYNVEINWTDDPDATRYFIYRNNTPSFNPILTSPIAETGYNYFKDINVLSGKWYYAIICEFDNGTLHNSSLSNNQSIQITNHPETPIMNIISASPYIDNITLGWASIPNAETYAIYRTQARIIDLKYHSPINQTTDTTYFDDPNDDITYFWTIVAINASGRSQMSNIQIAFVYSPIDAPILFGPNYNITNGLIELTWTNISDANIYYLYKSETYIESINGLTPYNQSDSTTLNHIERNYTLGDFYFVVVAGKTGLNSSISNCIKISLQDLPGIVYSVTIMNRDESQNWETNDRFVNLTWTSSSGATFYKIYRSQAYIEAETLYLADLVGIVSTTTFCDYSINSAAFNEALLYYAIVAGNGTGTAGPSYNESITVRFKSDPVIISPINNPINRTVILNWTSGTYGVSQYWIYRNYQPINTSNWESLMYNPIGYADNSEPFFIDRDVIPGIWYYVIIAINTQGMSNISNCESVEVIATPYQPILTQPNTPSFSRNITLNWTEDAFATQYYIFRTTEYFYETNLTDLTPIAILSFGSNVYSDLLVPGGFQYYGIIASNATGNSTLSNIVIVDVRYVPNSPEWVNMDESNFVNEILLQWEDLEGYQNFTVYRGNTSEIESQSTIILIANLQTTEYLTQIFEDGSYYFWIIAHNASGDSFSQNMLNLTGYFIPSPNLSLINPNPIINSNVGIRWNPLSHVSSYYIFRTISEETEINFSLPYDIVTDISGEYTDINVSLGEYFYYILPISSFGYGYLSESLNVRVESLPLAPIILNAKLSGMNIIIEWEITPGAEGYIVYHSENPINENTSLHDLTSSTLLNENTTSFTFKNVRLGTHYVCVVAVNATGHSKYSEIITIVYTIAEPEANLPMVIAVSIGCILAVLSPIIIKKIKENRNDPDRFLKKYT